MMRDYFIFDGVPSTDFGTFLASSNLFNAPAEDVQRVQVPGRSGDILIPNDRYENFAGEAVVAIPRNIRDFAEHLKGFLYSRKGYCRYAESYRPDRFRLAAYVGPFEMGTYNRQRGSLTLQFDCKPQIYLLSGDIAARYTADVTLVNPTRFAAQPMIRVYGAGAFAVGGYAVTIAAHAYPYIDLDCERMDAYSGASNCNALVSFSSDFPRLEPGDNAIVFGGGITALEITPRWWTL